MSRPTPTDSFDPTDRERSDPGTLAGPAAFAAVCGHKDTTRISHLIKTPTPDFPKPKRYKTLPSGRRRPLWALRDMWTYADRTPDRSNAGRPKTLPYRYAGDPRLTLARQLLAKRGPDTSTVALVQELRQQWTGPGNSVSTWQNILRVARAHPTDKDT